jgi:hypothetical protein
MRHGIAMNSALFQIIVLDLIVAITQYKLFMKLSRRECPVCCAVWEEVYSWLPTWPYSNSYNFFCGVIRGQFISENFYTIPELKTAIHLETEAISFDALIKVLNKFPPLLHKFHGFREHHMQHILIKQSDFLSAERSMKCHAITFSNKEVVQIVKC